MSVENIGRTAAFVEGVVTRAISFARSALEPVSSFASTMSSAENESVHKIAPEYQEFLKKQMEFQEQMQLVSFVSNAEKSKHETAMTPLRNVRVG